LYKSDTAESIREAVIEAVRLNISLSGANLHGIDLSGIDLTRADLAAADLSNADLTGATLAGTNLHFAVLAGANLRGIQPPWKRTRYQYQADFGRSGAEQRRIFKTRLD
jgi:uncharacterized protein YjbI with pentapeptide repeats